MDRLFFKNYLAQTSPEPMAFPITKARGSILFDDHGNKYIDLIGGISVSSIGHSHPNVVKAIQQQAEEYLHVMVYGEAVLSPQVQYAQKLVALLPEHLNNVYFTNSGAEAVEGAMKLAKRYTGRTEIIACHHSYHGSTQGALSLFGDEYFRNKFRPLLPDIRHIQHNHIPDLSLITERTAAVVVEVVQGEGGCLVPSSDWHKALRAQCDKVGAMLVFDEIQTGFGRTGSLWAFQDFDTYPDILLLGKALGGGMPLGAFIADKKIMDSLTDNPILGHMTTFGGHPVSCAAGMAALDVIVNENLVKDVAVKEALFRALLVHPKIKGIRGKGLMLAVQLESFDQVKQFINVCCVQHCAVTQSKMSIFTDWFLFASDCIRIVPALNISEEEIRTACTIILSALDEL